MGRRISRCSYPVTGTLACILCLVYLGQHHLLPALAPPPATDPWPYAYAVDTTVPFDVRSYATAAVTHVSGLHLLKNLTLLGAAGLLVEPRVSRAQFSGLFILTALAGTATFAISGNVLGADRLGMGASGGTYAMLAFAMLVVSQGTLTVRRRSVTLPLWVAPGGLILVEAARALTTPVIASPYPKYAHLMGVCLAIVAWCYLGCPRKPINAAWNPQD